MLKYVKLWLSDYAKPGVPDKRGLEDFLECETDEIVRLLRGELQGITRGANDEETLKNILGPGRAAKYGTFEEWAKMMLLWIAQYLKQ